MRQAGPATIESSSQAQPSLREFFSRRPVQLFGAVFVVAAVVYSYRLGADALFGAESFAAWSAAKPGIAAIARTPILEEPGKFLFYYGTLHYYTRIFGLSEVSLRSMSVILSLATLVLIFALGRQMFDESTAVAAAGIWAFNPLAVVFAHTARMYAMLIALVLAQLLTLWQVRERPSAGRAVLCGIIGAALLYTHMGGVLFIGAGLAMLVRDYIRGQRNPMPWLAIAITLALFAPYAPVVRAQSETLLAGHWLDWIGTAYEYPLAIKVLAALGAAAIAGWFVFAAAPESDRDDRLRWLGAWTILPGLALAAGSIVLRPMYNLRYIAPSMPTLALIVASAIGRFSVKWRNLLASGVALACLMASPLARNPPQPWRELTRLVASEGEGSDPIFFESGFVSDERTPNVPNGGFPFGYYSVPFNYYFKGANPRVTVPGFDPAAARTTIEQRVSSADGGWLVSWKGANAVKSELPDPKRFKVVAKLQVPNLTLYRITPAAK